MAETEKKRKVAASFGIPFMVKAINNDNGVDTSIGGETGVVSADAQSKSTISITETINLENSTLNGNTSTISNELSSTSIFAQAKTSMISEKRTTSTLSVSTNESETIDRTSLASSSPIEPSVDQNTRIMTTATNDRTPLDSATNLPNNFSTLTRTFSNEEGGTLLSVTNGVTDGVSESPGSRDQLTTEKKLEDTTATFISSGSINSGNPISSSNSTDSSTESEIVEQFSTMSLEDPRGTESTIDGLAKETGTTPSIVPEVSSNNAEETTSFDSTTTTPNNNTGGEGDATMAKIRTTNDLIGTNSILSTIVLAVTTMGPPTTTTITGKIVTDSTIETRFKEVHLSIQLILHEMSHNKDQEYLFILIFNDNPKYQAK
ncbi:hypothetical protein SNEBB_003345 [Seison nebaliae]|nr:hypothetical protein SNEBB_003345 [Seison nebaliae]